MAHIAIVLPQVEDDPKQNPEPKKKGKSRDLSRFTVSHLKKIRAAKQDEIDAIDDELASREDDGDGIVPGKMTERQHENWSKKMIAASEGNGS